jgi:hypothetical protein
MLKGLQVQIDAIQTWTSRGHLPEEISADKEIENDLAKYKLQLSEIGISDYTATAERRVELEAQAAETIENHKRLIFTRI